jgi:hypothetical protein
MNNYDMNVSARELLPRTLEEHTSHIGGGMFRIETHQRLVLPVFIIVNGFLMLIAFGFVVWPSDDPSVHIQCTFFNIGIMHLADL